MPLAQSHALHHRPQIEVIAAAAIAAAAAAAGGVAGGSAASSATAMHHLNTVIPRPFKPGH